MWLFAKEGFCSVVRNKDNPGLIHIRSQFRGDLERLGFEKIVETPCGDYRFRVDAPLAKFKEILCRLADGIDYIKFKPAVKDKSENRKESYLSVFNTMMQAGRDEQYAEYRGKSTEN